MLMWYFDFYLSTFLTVYLYFYLSKFFEYFLHHWLKLIREETVDTYLITSAFCWTKNPEQKILEGIGEAVSFQSVIAHM